MAILLGRILEVKTLHKGIGHFSARRNVNEWSAELKDTGMTTIADLAVSNIFKDKFPPGYLFFMFTQYLFLMVYAV